MQDRNKTKQQLIEELASLRARLEPGKGGGGGAVRSEAGLVIPIELYAMIFDKFPPGISVTRKDGSLIYVNPAFTRLTGYTLLDIDNEKKWFQKAYPDNEYRRQALYAWVKYQSQQIISEKVFQVNCKDGKFKSIEFNMITVSDGSVISVLVDVTGRGEAEELLREKEEHWRLLLETMNEGFITFNALGIPVFVNHRFCEMTGYSQEELIGRPASAFLDAENLLTFQTEFSQRSIGRLSPYEIVFKRKDGRPIYFLVSPRPLYDSRGRFVGSMGTCTDITERKTVEEALRQSEERYRTILGTIEDGYNEVDLTGRFTFFNESFRNMMGYDRDELLGMHYRQCTDKKNHVRVYEAYHQVYKTGTPLKNFEWEVTRKDGIILNIEVSVSLISDTTGRPMGFRGIVRDITDRKEMEEALRRSEEKNRLLLDNAMDAVARYSLDGTIIFNSQAIFTILGYRPEEIVGTSGFQYVHPDDRSNAQAVLMRIVESGESGTYEVRLLCKDGQYKWIEFSGRTFLDNLTGCREIVGVIRDISQRKKMEIELRERKERLKALANNLPGVIYQLFVRQDGDVGFHFISKRSIDVLGVDNNLPDTFKRLSACIPAEDRSRFVESIRHAALTSSRWEYEGRFITPKGEDKYVHCISIPDQRPGEVVFNGMALDITEQRRAEDALDESTRRYQELIESINEIVWEIDGTGRFAYISPSIEKLIGYGQQEVIGRLPYEFACTEDMERLKEHFHGFFGNHDSFDVVEGTIVHKRGFHVAVEVSGNPFYGKDGRFGGYRGILRDVSSIKKLQEEMIKSQKLDSIGTLAGGIAHDFNNLLMGILGYIGLAKLNIQQEKVVERSLSKAEESCMRAKELALRLLTFSRGGDPLMKTIDIRDAVRESAKLVLSGSNIQCRYYLAKDLHPVRADEGQIRQTIGNIVINAVEASPAGGTISVKGENVHYRRKEDKPFIKLTISDRGKGISPESLRSIFDPYFTTKDMGALKGTGLGLSISYSIIKKHGGDISVQSELGKGTSVSIYLPACGDITQAKGCEKKDSSDSGRPEASVKRILVMDDEELIRSFMEETMSFLGYDVTTCPDGGKALELYRDAMASGRPYNLVVLDLTVRGGLGGQETIQRLLDIDPAVTAIICSGYTDDPVISHFGAYGFKEAWGKPTSLSQIKTTLKSVFND